MPTRKLWNHTIDTKKGFTSKKRKMYLLLREEREKICEFISKQLGKGYMSRSRKVDLVSFNFFFLIFIFILIYFPFLFLELRIRVKPMNTKRKA